ncbi:F-box/LRR-repeat protein 2-like [Anneissia japonica]|uniref:F-box/LRR-repeat protein 2-like n=1 Tax=Anneissia japonica TaxID=1529436 RepID=UPI0014254EE5|nr:F-box/LRR-repeat protein 2-like [Anneissia japonica]
MDKTSTASTSGKRTLISLDIISNEDDDRKKQKINLIKPSTISDLKDDISLSTTSSDKQTIGNLFLNLPDEIMVCNVLPLLDIMEVCICKAVCRRWRGLVHAYFSQLKELDLSPWNFLIYEEHLIAIVRHLRSLKYLRLGVCWKAVTECSLSSIASSCPKLEVFTANRCGNVTDSAISKLVTRCHNLQELDLSSCYNVTDVAIVEIARHCKHLKELYLSSIYSVTGIGIKELAQHSKSLEELDVSYCFTLTNESMLHLLHLKQCGSLKSLRITGCSKISEDITLKLLQAGIIVNNMF